MGDYAYLNLDEENIYDWKWYIPEKDISVLSFIFKSSDKKVIKRDDSRRYYLIYEADLSIVRKRLRELNFSYEKINNALKGLLSVSERDLEIALMDERDFL